MIHPKKNPRDINQMAAKIVALSTGQIEIESEPEVTLTPEQRNAYAKEFARKGGLVGGKARAASMSKAARVRVAKAGAAARWKKK